MSGKETLWTSWAVHPAPAHPGVCKLIFPSHNPQHGALLPGTGDRLWFPWLLPSLRPCGTRPAGCIGHLGRHRQRTTQRQFLLLGDFPRGPHPSRERGWEAVSGVPVRRLHCPGESRATPGTWRGAAFLSTQHSLCPEERAQWPATRIWPGREASLRSRALPGSQEPSEASAFTVTRVRNDVNTCPEPLI